MREPYPNELYHFGILGQKWGVRRFQNPDGSLTEAGRKRYLIGNNPLSLNDEGKKAMIKRNGSFTRVGKKYNRHLKNTLSEEERKKALEDFRFTESDKKKYREHAKRGMFMIDFVEAIQNTKINYENDTNALLKEYDKFLDNPSRYVREDAGKLPRM